MCDDGDACLVRVACIAITLRKGVRLLLQHSGHQHLRLICCRADLAHRLLAAPSVKLCFHTMAVCCGTRHVACYSTCMRYGTNYGSAAASVLADALQLSFNFKRDLLPAVDGRCLVRVHGALMAAATQTVRVRAGAFYCKVVVVC